MKKTIVFIMSAVLAVSLGSFSFAEAQKTSIKAFIKPSAKAPAKPAAKAPPAPKKEVILKGVQIYGCGDVTDNGTIEIVKGVILPVKKGKFDMVLPSILGAEIKKPAEDAEESYDVEIVGDVRVVRFYKVNFKNSNPKSDQRGWARLSTGVYYTDKDVKVTDDYNEEISLKKGWNVIGDKNSVSASFGCAG